MGVFKNQQQKFQEDLASFTNVSSRFQGSEGMLQFSHEIDSLEIDTLLQFLWKHHIHLTFYDTQLQSHFDYFLSSKQTLEGYWSMCYSHQGYSWGEYQIQSKIVAKHLGRLIQSNPRFDLFISERTFGSSHGIRSLEASVKMENKIVGIAL